MTGLNFTHVSFFSSNLTLSSSIKYVQDESEEKKKNFNVLLVKEDCNLTFHSSEK